MAELTEREWSFFSLSRAIRAASDGGLDRGIERDILREHAEVHGLPYAPNRFTVPWSILRRDLTSQTAYPIVATETAGARDALRESSLVAKLGAEILAELRGELVVPMLTNTVAGGWLADENAPMSAAQPTIGQVTLTPKNAAALVTFSHLLLKQAPATDQLLAQHLTRSVGWLLDQAALNGSGSSGVPQGILQTTGPGTFTIDATDAIGDALGAIQARREAGAEPTAWVTTPAIVTALSKRERAAGNGMVIEDGKLCGLPVIATAACPTGKAILGDFSKLLVALWRGGVEVATDPFSSFVDGRVSLRVMIATDVAMIHRGAFAYGAAS